MRQANNVGPFTLNGQEQPYGFVRPDGTVNVGGAYGFTGSGDSGYYPAAHVGSTAWFLLAAHGVNPLR